MFQVQDMRTAVEFGQLVQLEQGRLVVELAFTLAVRKNQVKVVHQMTLSKKNLKKS